MADDEKAWRDAFLRMDANGNGYITPNELSSALELLGHDPKVAKVKAKRLMHHLDDDKDGKISMEEFVSFMQKLGSADD